MNLSALLRPLVAAITLVVFGVASPRALVAQTPPPSPAQAPPDESVLGTVEVNGSAAGGMARPPPPKLAVVPLITQTSADSIAQVVTKKDLDLSGQYEVIDDALAPSGPWMRDKAIDWKAWLDKEKKLEVIVKVYAVSASAGGKTTLVADVYYAPTKDEQAALADAGAPAIDAPPPPPPKPALTVKMDAGANELRAASHRLVDQLLGGLTGRPGGFASKMAYGLRVGKWRQIFTLDSDGFDMKPYGPSTGISLSPVYGPGGEVFYTISEEFRPYKIAHGPQATGIPMVVAGNVLAISFSPDRRNLALSLWDKGQGAVYASAPTGTPLRQVSKAPFANEPSYGPMGKIAYVAGVGAKRVYIDDKAISPPGFMASGPSFCDTPDGLVVVFTVGYGAWADIIAVDTNAGGIRRLTQNMGANSSPTCSPDGRMVAFFSNRGAPGKGPGMYILPIQRPWLAKKIANEVGENLRWDPITR